ncbi:hypothetical protein GCK32_001335 [Trichostrongylus colubriformis]|uniref:Uncharacterized protein n=1 Tax=Trichostrongylus colubriformis TaxID=6319 RepID=A0AAN8IFM9_TRICO
MNDFTTLGYAIILVMALYLPVQCNDRKRYEGRSPSTIGLRPVHRRTRRKKRHSPKRKGKHRKRTQKPPETPKQPKEDLDGADVGAAEPVSLVTARSKSYHDKSEKEKYHSLSISKKSKATNEKGKQKTPTLSLSPREPYADDKAKKDEQPGCKKQTGKVDFYPSVPILLPEENSHYLDEIFREDDEPPAVAPS